MSRSINHVVGFDDGPFSRAHRGDVPVVGAVCTGQRLDGVLYGRVRRDGVNSTQVLARTVKQSHFRSLQLIMLQGIALAGFNVVDIQRLHEETGCAVMVVARHPPHMDRIRNALTDRVRGGVRKWRWIENAGPMEPVAGVYVQRAGISAASADGVIRKFAVNSRIPEPLRLAHIIAAGLSPLPSRQRV